MYEMLRTILVEDMQCCEHDVRPTAERAELGLHSLAAVELSSLLENRLGIAIADYELLDSRTVGDITQLMEQRTPPGFGRAARPGSIVPT